MAEESSSKPVSDDKKSPKSKKGKIVAIAALLIAGYIGYLMLPEPNTVRVTVNSPGITDLRSENPKPEPLTLHFSESAANLDSIGKAVTGGIEISPRIAGQWRWNSDTELMFRPSEYWAIETDYSITLDEDLFPSHIVLNDYSPGFQTPGFSANLIDVNFHQDPRDPKVKKLFATVQFTHRVDQEDFKQRISLQINATDQRIKTKPEDYPFSVSYDETGTEAYIQSESVDIPLKQKELLLTISDKSRALLGGARISEELTGQVTVPGMYSFFRISTAKTTLVRNEHNEPEQVLIIETTDGVTTEVLQNNIEVYELPSYRPAQFGRRAMSDYHWSRPEQVGPEILSLSKRVELDFLPTDREYATQHSIKFSNEPQRYLYIRLKKGIKSVGGYILAETFDRISRIPAFPKELEIMAKGGVLSLSGNKKLSVVSRGNEAIQFEIGRVLPDQIQHLVSQTNGEYQNPYFQGYRFNQDNITTLYTKVKRLKSLPPGKSQYTSFDFSSYLNKQAKIKNGMFFIKVRGWDPARERTTHVEDKRLILVTDLGLLVKKNADKSRNVYVVGLNSGKPVGNASVDVIGKNGLSVFSTKTDGQGAATLPNLKDFKRDKAPTAILVKKQGDLSFIPYDRNDRNLDLSRFDVGGIRQEGKKDGVSRRDSQTKLRDQVPDEYQNIVKQ